MIDNTIQIFREGDRVKRRVRLNENLYRSGTVVTVYTAQVGFNLPYFSTRSYGTVNVNRSGVTLEVVLIGVEKMPLTSKTEFTLRVIFKTGSQFHTVRMTESEAQTLFESLDPAKAGNDNVKEVQLYRYDVTEDVTFIARRPVWGA